jgi:hypothetical protein
MDNEQFELGARNLLLLDPDDLSYAVRGVNDELACLEPLPLMRRLLRVIAGVASSSGLRARSGALATIGAFVGAAFVGAAFTGAALWVGAGRRETARTG